MFKLVFVIFIILLVITVGTVDMMSDLTTQLHDAFTTTR